MLFVVYFGSLFELWMRGCHTQVDVIRTAPRDVAPPHHIMKEVNPILTQNLRLGKPMLNGLQYDSQETGARVAHTRHADFDGADFTHFLQIHT